MSDWINPSIDNACHILDNLRIPVSETERNKRNGNVPYYGANGIQGYIDDYIFNEKLILLAEDGGNFEDYSMRPIAYRIDGYSWVNNHAHVLKAKIDFDIDYIFYSLQHKNILKHITGGTRGKLNQSELKSITFECPSNFKEQKTIATILDTIDEAIDAAEAQLAKQEKIKQGLLQDLLTRGIDETGQIRPHWEDKPDLYKKTELGLVPLNWEINRLENLALKIQDGTHFSPKTGNGQFLYITSKNIKFGHIDLSNVETIDEVQHAEIYRRCDVREGDLLLTKDGANTGNAAINTISEQISLLSSVAFIRFDPDKDAAQFHLQYLLSQNGQRRLKDLMSGNAITRLTLQKIRNFAVLRPTLIEQNTIIEILSAADDDINILRTEIRKLAHKKTGLMQDLLTGQRRVTQELVRQVETLTGPA